jgi:hypothetical protein
MVLREDLTGEHGTDFFRVKYLLTINGPYINYFKIIDGIERRHILMEK